jgi:hypothetical protein
LVRLRQHWRRDRQAEGRYVFRLASSATSRSATGAKSPVSSIDRQLQFAHIVFWVCRAALARIPAHGEFGFGRAGLRRPQRQRSQPDSGDLAHRTNVGAAPCA